MTPIGIILTFTTLGVFLVGCQDNPPTKDQSATQPTTQPISIPTRLSLADATAAVRKEIFRAKPGMNPSAEFPLAELTTPEIWDRLHAQVFVVTDDIYRGQAYILHDQHTSPLGESFGGHGVMSMCVVTPTPDGNPALLFTYSFGSGEHRSLVALWTSGPAWLDAKPALGEYDLSLEKLDDGHVRVAYGKFDPASRKFEREGELGRVEFGGDKENPQMKLVLAEGLAEEVQGQLRK